MTSQTERERQCVYLTYRDLFCGSKARVRNRKIIRKIVLKHSSQSGNDVHEQHLGRTINILNTLLKDRVFEFERTARRTFPDLFAKSLPVPHTVTSSTEQDIMAERPTKTKQWHKDKREGLAHYPSNGIKMRISKGEDNTSTSLGLTSVELPFEAQHLVLLRVQQLLEEACFRFMERWLPAIVAQHEWKCAAAIELTKSLTIIKTNLEILPADCMDAPTQSLFIEIAPHVAQLRHAAVHRLHLKHDEFLQRVECAHKLAGILHDLEKRNILQALRSQVYAVTKKLEYETRIINQKADCILSQLSQQRDIIAQREQQLRDTVARKGSELAAAAGRAILEPIEMLSFTSDSNGTNRGSEVHKTIETGACIDEDDIDSDEDRLRAELG